MIWKNSKEGSALASKELSYTLYLVLRPLGAFNSTGKKSK